MNMRCFKYLVLFILFAFSFFTKKIKAQDARLSQFYKAPIQLNPAMSGVFNGKMRVAINHRSLYSSLLSDQAFRTTAGSVDIRMQSRKGDFFSPNLSVMNDISGEAKFSRLNVRLGGAYLKKLGGSRYRSGDQYLIAGAQLGFGQYRIESADLWFSSQYDNGAGGIDPNLPSGENVGSFTGDPFLDASAGVLWYNAFEKDQSIFIGGAVHHINQPDISFFEGQEEQLPMRWTVHAGGEVPLSRYISILPGAAMMQQGPSTSISAGGNLRYTRQEWKELAMRGGAWLHLSNQLESSIGLDAIVYSVVFELDRWSLGLSYDTTVSSLRRSNFSRGAFEVSFVYFTEAVWRTRVECPKY